ncbi:MAG: hypothetical protein Kow0080_00270 [Candidatus Promineifilaceae bacterium]
MGHAHSIKASQRTRKEQIRRKEQQKKTTVILIILGVVLVIWGIYIGTSDTNANTGMDYLPEDVVYDQPIHAIHEMSEGPPIPFLPRGGEQPAIQIPEISYNFGSIGPQDMVEHKFIIRNAGNAPLTISRAYTTCGCTTAEITASVIPPGKVAEVTIIFNAGFHAEAAGQTVRRGLIIENNDPQHSKAEIWIQASVRKN